MKVGILGSGFGIYGYLPAIINSNYKALTLEKYRPLIEKRHELQKYVNNISFLRGEEELIENIDALVLARTPKLQYEFLCKQLLDGVHLFLEKPIAPTCDTHEDLIYRLKGRDASFSIAYLFEFTKWWANLKDIFTSAGLPQVSINWTIVRPNSDWKNNTRVGGGFADYYGIHFIPLLIELGFSVSDIKITARESDLNITATMSGNAEFVINLTYGDTQSFEVYTHSQNGTTTSIFIQSSPFGLSPNKGAPDPRISYLGAYLSRFNIRAKISLDTYYLEKEILNFRRLAQESLFRNSH